MSRSRRAGLIVAGIASALWVVVLVTFFSATPQDGVSFGGTVLAMLAVPLSLAASVLLLVSLWGERRAGSGARSLAAPRWAAAALTVTAMALLCTVFVLAPTGSLSADTMVAFLLSGIGAFLAAFALYLLPVDHA